MDYSIALRKYEDYLIGRSNFVLKPPSYLALDEEDDDKDSIIAKSKEDQSLAVIRYAISEILEMEPIEAYYRINEKLIDKLKLKKAIANVEFPSDLKRSRDLWWVVYKAFPDEIKVSKDKRIVDLCHKIINGEDVSIENRLLYGSDAVENIHILLHHMISLRIPASKLIHLYDFFGNKKAANEFLEEAQIKRAVNKYYETPLDLFHDSLKGERNELLYKWAKFNEFYNKRI